MNTDDLFLSVEQRALIYLQTTEHYHDIVISESDELREIFLLGVYLGAMAAVEVFGENNLFEQHTGEEYDYLYEDEDDDIL